VLYYGLAGGDVGASLLTYRQGSEDGYFLLLVTPRAEPEAGKVAAKDVILVLDTSGSMSGQKIMQAKDALRFVLNNLNADDRFGLISFNTTISRLREGLLPASEREAAHRYVDGLNAAGSTNINGALLESLKGLDAGRPTVIIFLTDGLPTVGVTDTGRIVENFRQAAPKSVRLFTFGVGYDVNTALLDTLAANHRGASAYVKPGEDLEEAVSNFYAKINKPVLTDLSVDFGGIRTYDLYPTPLPDLFAGGQLVLVGRYRNSGPTTIALKGNVNDRPRQYTYDDIVFPKETASDTAFVARLWATRRIGYLLTEIRLHGTNKELVDEIVSLSLRYGIITPYTSFLVDERQNVLAPGGEKKASEQLNQKLAAPAPTAGAGAVHDSQMLRGLREAPSAAPVTESAQMQTVADKSFILRNGVWTDTRYQEGTPTVDVGFGSEDYFNLVAARPDWAKYFALGDKVIVVLDGTAYRVAEGSFPPISIPPMPTPVKFVPTPTVVPPAPTPAPTGTVTPPPDEPVNLLLQVWRWLLSLLRW